jgi:hypothetical protein
MMLMEFTKFKKHWWISMINSRFLFTSSKPYETQILRCGWHHDWLSAFVRNQWQAHLA